MRHEYPIMHLRLFVVSYICPPATGRLGEGRSGVQWCILFDLLGRVVQGLIVGNIKKCIKIRLSGQ